MAGSRKRHRSGNTAPSSSSTATSSNNNNKSGSKDTTKETSVSVKEEPLQQSPSQSSTKPVTQLTSQEVSLQDIESHPDYIKRKKVILNTKMRKSQEADRNRQLQIDNINQLYSFELEDLEAKYKVECEQLKQSVYDRLMEQQRLADQSLPSSSNSRMNTRQTANVENTDDLSQEAARSSVNNAFSHNGNAAKATTTSRASSLKKSNGNVFGSSIDKVLPEESVREDFVSIVRDLEDRAVNYTKQQRAKLPPLDVEITDNSLVIRSRPRRGSIDTTNNSTPSNSTPKEDIYRVGCMVTIHSTDSDEQLNGKIMVIGEDDVIVRLHTGPRLRIPLAQLRDRRVSILRDAEIYRDLAIILAAR
mmetsp:Transcript_7070/g.10569  ORF Transcript_7070/g.10569 Transcript_7070/m.10569 type:complete len:361 (-) Transcript_7070:189-1271(-)